MSRLTASAPDFLQPPSTPPKLGAAASRNKPTPHRTKLASLPQKPPLIHQFTDPMLAAELSGAKLENVPRFVEHMFPDECLPMPPTQLFAALSSPGKEGSDAPLYTDSRWVDCPDLSQSSKNGDVEKALAGFLQTLATRSAEILCATGKRLPAKPRRWTGERSTTPISDGPNTRCPDILCVDGDTCGWPDILIHGELKSGPSLKGQSITQLVNGAYHVFSMQDDRRFFVGLSIIAHKVHLVIFDRSGMTMSSPLDIHADPELFLRLITALTFCTDRARLGYDTSIVTDATGRRFIEVEGRSYELRETLFVSDVIRGRGTVCWRACHDGRDYVIKDIWADTSRPHSEAEILRMAEAAHVSGVPVVVADVVVQINGADDTTDNVRATITKECVTKKVFKTYTALEKRVHRRTVLTPVCLPLTSFTSRKELISILIDAVTAHRDLVDANILHRDISLNNIMVSHEGAVLPLASSDLPPSLSIPSPQRVAPRRGLLIDMDYALVLENLARSGPSIGHRTGTLPFMAVDVLIYGDTDSWAAHEPKHDLESFLYVLIWICWHYAGPRDVERCNFNIHKNAALRDWVTGNYPTIGRCKRDAMKEIKDWNQIILANFAPYFEPLKPCVSAWRQLFVDDNLTHDSVLAALNDALPGLEEMEIWTRHNDPAGYGVIVGAKRKRAGNLAQIDEEDDEEGENEDKDDEEQEDAEDTTTPDAPPTPAQYFHSAPLGKVKIIHKMRPRPIKRHKSAEELGI